MSTRVKLSDSPTRPEYWIHAACEAFCVTREELLSQSRAVEAVRFRQAAMWIAREMTSYPYPALAKSFERQDHTTILSAVRRAESDPLIIALIEEIFEHVESRVDRE